MSSSGFFIKNILVISDGEYRNSSHTYGHEGHFVICDDKNPDPGRVDRILDQIKLLGELAKNAKTKEDPQQLLTRVVTDEFSFYTKNTPLTIDEYKNLINKVSESLKNLPPNIVLIISSMPVLWPDGTLRNAVLHIQSPNDQQSAPLIHHFSKEVRSSVDPDYSEDGSMDHCYIFCPDDYVSQFSPNIVLQETKAQCNDPNQYKSAIVVQGCGLPAIMETVDVCVDHPHGIAMYHGKRLLMTNPVFFANHILTSNTFATIEDRLISSAVHADRTHNKTIHMASNKTDLREDTSEALRVSINSAFGANSVAYVYPAIRAEVVHSELFDIARKEKEKTTPIASMVDSENNTLLHEVLFQNKQPNHACIHRGKRLNTLLQYFDGNTINQQNKNGDTPLHLAIENLVDENMLVKFLERGARLDIKNNDGLTPIDIAYNKGKDDLVIALYTKVVNNMNAYYPHRLTILTLINKCKDEKMKKKLIKASLCFELSLSSPDENIVISLLKAANHSKKFIENNFTRLLDLSSSKQGLYEYLQQDIFNNINQSQISTLPTSIKLCLLKRELASGNTDNDRINLLLDGIDQLRNSFATLQDYLTDEECEKLLTFKMICPHGIKHLNADEQKIVKAYVSSNPNTLDNMPLTLQQETITRVANAFNTRIAQHIKFWINDELDRLNRQQSLIAEFKKGQEADLTTIFNLLIQGFNLESACGLESKLTIAEQALATYYTNKETNKEVTREKIRDLINTVAHLLNEESIQKIAGSFPEKEKEKVKVWIYQVWMEQTLYNYMLGYITDPQVILIALSQGKVVWNQAYDGTYTLAEQAVAYACASNNVEILKKVYVALKKENLSIDVSKVAARFAYPERAFSWINQGLVQIDPVQSMRNEFKSTFPANLSIIMYALSQNINMKEDCGLASQLSLAEQAVATFFLNRHRMMPDQIRGLFNLVNHQLNREIIQKIANAFPDKEKEEVTIWIYTEWIKNELYNKQYKNQYVDTTAIMAILSQGKAIWNQPYNETFTIAEQVLCLAYLIFNVSMLRKVYSELKKEAVEIDIDKLAKSFQDSHEVYNWFQRQLNQIDSTWVIRKFDPTQYIKFELTRCPANLKTILKLISDNLNNIDFDQVCGPQDGFNIAEQIIVLFFINRNQIDKQEIVDIFYNLSPILNEGMIQNIANPFLLKEEVTTWIYTEWIKGELLRLDYSEEGTQNSMSNIIKILAQGKDIWSQPCGTLTVAEQVVVQAYYLKNLDMLEAVYSELKKEGLAIDINKIAKSFIKSHEVVNWLTQQLSCFDKESSSPILEKFKKLPNNDPKIFGAPPQQNVTASSPSIQSNEDNKFKSQT